VKAIVLASDSKYQISVERCKTPDVALDMYQRLPDCVLLGTQNFTNIALDIFRSFSSTVNRTNLAFGMVILRYIARL